MGEQLPIYFGLSAMMYHPQAGISTLLVNELSKAGFPDLEGGRIRVGHGKLTSRVAPPSIVATWAGGRGAGSEYGRENISSLQPTQPVLNALATHIMRVDYHVWAASPQPEAEADEDACMFLIHQLWRVIHKVGVEGAYEMVGIETLGQPKSALGFQAIMSVDHRVPVTDELQMYVPPGLSGAITVGFSNATTADQVVITGVS